MLRFAGGLVRWSIGTPFGSERRLRLRRLGMVALLPIALLTLSACVADSPPLIGTAVRGDGQATVTWQAPVAAPVPITAYVVTPWIGSVAQSPVTFNSTATTQNVTGLTNGTTYTFTVRAVNALGNDSASSSASNPVTPRLLASALATGFGHTCAVVAAGAVKCWGLNGNGQLGNGTTTDASTPVTVNGINYPTGTAAGGSHTCALLTDGAIKCWGNNSNGQLGNGTTTNSSTPVQTPWP